MAGNGEIRAMNQLLFDQTVPLTGGDLHDGAPPANVFKQPRVWVKLSGGDCRLPVTNDGMVDVTMIETAFTQISDEYNQPEAQTEDC